MSSTSLSEKSFKIDIDDCYATDSASVPSTLGYPRHSSDDDDRSDYITERTRRSFLGRTMLDLGFGSKRPRRIEIDYFSGSKDRYLEDALNGRSPTRDHRRCGRSRVAGVVKRACIFIPVCILALIGVLHLTHWASGSGSSPFDIENEDNLFPEWGLPGHVGEDLSHYPTDATRDVLPVPIHSHNDYWRDIPLFTALHTGCISVEADVWNFDEELYVGHSLGSLTRERTFRSLYINPLVDLLDKMNTRTNFANGTTQNGVFDQAPEQSLVLLVDLKTSGKVTFPLVEKRLQALREKGYLTHWNGEKIVQRAVTVVGTGYTTLDLVTKSSTYRDIFLDAPLDKLWEAPPNPSETANSASPSITSRTPSLPTPPTAHNFNTTNSYYASTSFRKTVGFVWGNRLSAPQKDIIRGQIRGAQRRGLKVRYWETPSWPVGTRNHVWRFLMKEGADVLNADDLPAAAREEWRVRTRTWWKN